MSSTDSACQFCCRIIASCMASRSESISGYADMTVFNSSVFVSSNLNVFQLHVCVQSWLVTSELQLGNCSVHNLKTDCESILLELSKRVLALGHSRLGGRLCHGNSRNGTSLSRHKIMASSNRAWTMSHCPLRCTVAAELVTGCSLSHSTICKLP